MTNGLSLEELMKKRNIPEEYISRGKLENITWEIH